MTNPPQSTEDSSVERIVIPKSAGYLNGDHASQLPTPENAKDGTSRPEPVVPDESAPEITLQDPRFESIEKLLDVNDWRGLSSEMAAMDDASNLPPNLGLIAALASNESATGGDPAATATAIRCMAGLLGVQDDSPIARVLARRMLRKNPVRFRERKAPRARTSALIVLLTLLIGGGVGFLASAGSWRGVVHQLSTLRNWL